MKKINFILYEDEYEGNKPSIPIAIFRGESKEEAVINIIRIIAKYLAKGDVSLIQEKEALVIQDKELITELINEDLEGGAFYGDTLICVEPLYNCDESHDIVIDGLFQRYRSVLYDENNRRFYDESEIPVMEVCEEESDLYTIPDDELESVQRELRESTHYVPVITSDSFDSPFLYPSPFILNGRGAFAVDAENGRESEMFEKIQHGDDFYIVYRIGKAGVVSLSGKLVLDCFYDKIDCNLGYVILWKDYRVGLYDSKRNLLIPCEYDDIDFPDIENTPDYVYVWKRGEKGLLSTDGSFHPLSEINRESRLDYLLA